MSISSKSVQRKRSRAIVRAADPMIEPLENRRLLSTINWSNRGNTGSDTDGFGSVFGTNAELARNVVAAAMRHWGRVIANFNYIGGGNTYQMTVNMAGAGTSAGANAGPTHYNGTKPDQGSMTIGRGGDNGTDGIGDGVGYYLDPNPDDYIEFGGLPISTAGSTANAFAGYAGTGSAARNLGDLYELALHELGHAMGISSNAQMNAFATDTGTGDTQSSMPAVANYWLFDGPSIETLMTGFDSGGQGGGASNGNGTQHFAPPNATAVVNGVTYVGADDLMNPFYSGSQRRLISNADALMLKDAYGYTITMPETFGTFYANLNRSNGYLYVSGGAGDSSDTISINAVGSEIVVSVDLGTDIPGTGPTDAFVSKFTNTDVNRIYINGGGGTDYLRVDGTFGQDVYVYGESGDDFIDLGFNFPNVSAISDHVYVDGGSGNNRLFIYDQGNSGGSNWNVTNFSAGRSNFGGLDYSNVTELTLNTGNGADTIDLVSSNIPMFINSNGGGDTLTLAGGANNLDAITADVNFNGGAGFNYLVLDDHTRSTPSVASIYAAYFTMPNGKYVDFTNVSDRTYNAGGDSDLIFALAGSSTTRINGNGGADQILVLGGSNVPIIDGGAGSDRITIGGGNILANTPASANVTGGPGFDTLVLDDSTANNSYSWEIFNDNVLYASAIPFAYGGMEKIGILAGTGQNTFSINSAPVALELNGGAGSDRFQFNSAINNYESNPLALPFENPIEVIGGSGSDEIQVNDLARLGVAYTLTSTTYRSAEGTSGLAFSFDGTSEGLVINAGNLGDGFVASNYNFNTNVTISGGNGNDSLTVYPDPTAPQTALHNFTFFGGGNTDTFDIADTNETSDLTWETNDLQVIRRKGIVAPWYFIHSGIEQLNLTAGVGADRINLLQSPAVPLAVNGGDGADFINIVGTGFNGFALQPVNLAGGDGNDIVQLDDSAWSFNSTYGISSSSISRSFSQIINCDNFEQMIILGGSGSDTYIIPSVSIYTYLDAGAGNDSVIVGGFSFQVGGGTLENITNYLGLSGSTGNDTLTYNDENDTTGDQVHYDGYNVGYAAGDNFFGGGFSSSDYFEDTIFNLGSGADTIFTRPSIHGPATFNANNPTSSPGDSITFAMSGTTNPVQVSTGVGAGHVDVTGGPSVFYSGIEQSYLDSVAPSITSSEFLFEQFQQFKTYFSEDVAFYPNPYTLYDSVTNTPFGASFSAGTGLLGGGYGITFSGFPSGRLPDGRYRIEFNSSLVEDYAGNPLTQPTTPLEFSFLMGDATHDLKVDTQDFNILAGNFGGSNKVFSQGNFSYDAPGQVDSIDFNIFAAQYGKSLPAPAAPSPIIQLAASPSPFGTLRFEIGELGDTGFEPVTSGV